MMSKSHLLEIHPNAVQEIRKMYNLDKSGRMEEAIDILEKWILQENHILKKDFSKEYLERTLIVSKGSVERAKKRIDALCTMRTLTPQLFTMENDYKSILSEMLQINLVPLPKLTEDFYRVIFIRAKNVTFTAQNLFKTMQYGIILMEYLSRNDYYTGFLFVNDLRDMDLLGFIKNSSAEDFRQLLSAILKGYGTRIKGLHIVSESKAIDVFKNVLRRFLKNKIGDRIFVYKTFDELFDMKISRDIFPVDYGGKEKPLDTLTNDWSKILFSEENIAAFKHTNKACTDESLRPAGKFNEEYLGMPGSFRSLTVD